MILFRKEFLFYLSCIILITSAYLYGCNQNADNDKTKTNNLELKTSFDSYNQLDNYLQNKAFNKYNYDTSRSSWIRGAKYYYYEKAGMGYLKLNLKGRDYIYLLVPLEVWNSFKNADSLGRYFNQDIKGHYIYLKKGK